MYTISLLKILSSSWQFFNLLSSRCNSSSCSFWSKTCICSTGHVRHTFLIFEQFYIFLSSAQTVSSSRDFGVEQIFRADEFRADDPSPEESVKRWWTGWRISQFKTSLVFRGNQQDGKNALQIYFYTIMSLNYKCFT